MLKLEFELPLTRTYWFYVSMFEFVQFIYTASPKSHFTRSDRLQCLSTFTLSPSVRSLLFFLFRHILLHFIFAPVGFGFHRFLLNSAGWLFMALCQFTRHVFSELCLPFAIPFHRSRPHHHHHFFPPHTSVRHGGLVYVYDVRRVHMWRMKVM